MEFSKVGQKAEAANIDSVSFGDCVIKTTLSTGYDGQAPKEHRRDVTIIAELSDADPVIKAMLDRVASGVRITVNQTSGILKSAPGVIDHETYAEYLDSIDCKVELDSESLAELYEPTKRTQKDMTPQEGLDVMLKAGKLTKKQHAEMSAMLK